MKDNYGFLTFKNYRKKMMRARTHINVKCQFSPGDLFEAESLIIRREIIRNRYLK